MTDCPFETDVLDALASHRWPARAGADLRAHVAACDSCRDLADTAGALLHEHDAAYAEARVPPSAVIWHRAQLRAREEAARAATRPIGFVQGVAFACGIALALGAAMWGLPLLPAWALDLPALLARVPAVAAPDVSLGDLVALTSNTTVQIAMAGWLLLLVPVAGYLALSRE